MMQTVLSSLLVAVTSMGSGGDGSTSRVLSTGAEVSSHGVPGSGAPDAALSFARIVTVRAPDGAVVIHLPVTSGQRIAFASPYDTDVRYSVWNLGGLVGAEAQMLEFVEVAQIDWRPRSLTARATTSSCYWPPRI